MCTALTLTTKDKNHLFGRNMDIEYSFGQAVQLVPRNFKYKNVATDETVNTKYAMIGMGTLIDEHPMYAEAMNEKGLTCAGLNFPGYAYYTDEVIEGKTNIPPFDVIPWVLGNFETIEELRPALENLNLVNKPINSSTPLPTLHWIVSDKNGDCIVIENTKEKLSIFENKVGVLTNSPTFDWHMTNLNQYIGMQPTQPDNTRWHEQDLVAPGQGIGLIGLPGDFSPASRFVRIAFMKSHAVLTDNEHSAVSEFFHMLDNVAMVRGTVVTPQGRDDITQYSSCMCQEKGIYYYKTYNNSQINVIDMNKEDLDSDKIKIFNYEDKLSINHQN